MENITPDIPHRAGFVNIVGNPNVGKSTLMNDLVGERISIITSKAQTTRHRIMGIVNDPAYQIVYSDTPGVLKPKYKLQESMLEFSEGALTDADILLYVTDVVEDPGAKGSNVSSAPKIVSISVSKNRTAPQQTIASAIVPINATEKYSFCAFVSPFPFALPNNTEPPIPVKSPRLYIIFQIGATTASAAVPLGP